ncbi:MAG: efflux RND transporter periplasmic adaptor subunit [Puniceicoccales bacterium]
MKKALFTLLVLLLAIGITALMILSKPKPASRPIEVVATPVEVLRAHATDLTLTVQAQGTVTPQLQATLAAEVGGRITSVSDAFEEAGFVVEGEILLSLDPTDYQAAVAEAKANLRSAQTSLVQAEADAEQAIRDLQEVGVSDPSPLARREPQLQQARLRVDSAEAALALAEKNLERTQIRAPFDGQLVETLVDIGDVLSGRGTPVATLYGTGFAEIHLPLSRPEIQLLDLPDNPEEIAGPPESKPSVQFTLGHGNTQATTTRGWIDRLAGTTDPITRLRNAIGLFADPLDLQGDGSSGIPFGSFVSAEIEGRTIPSAFRLPVVALIGENRIRVVDDENRLQEREIRLLQMTSEDIIVTEGLHDGDRVCLTPLTIFAPGMLVRPTLTGEEFDSTSNPPPPSNPTPDAES